MSLLIQNEVIRWSQGHIVFAGSDFYPEMVTLVMLQPTHKSLLGEMPLALERHPPLI